LRIVIEVRNNGEGLVAAIPRIGSRALVGRRYRSMLAGLIASGCARTSGLYRSTPTTSSPCRSRPSSSALIATARYLSHCPPEAAHTFCSTLSVS